MTDRIVRLEVEGPVAICSGCRFRTALDGEWHAGDGILRWTAKKDPLTRRGPSLDHCGECAVEYTQLELDGMPLPNTHYSLLKKNAKGEKIRPWDFTSMGDDDGYL